MQVTVRLFAAARAVVDAEALTVDVPDSAQISDVRSALIAAHPDLQPILRTSRLAMQQEYVSDDQVVVADAELAIIPPVSGG